MIDVHVYYILEKSLTAENNRRNRWQPVLIKGVFTEYTKTRQSQLTQQFGHTDESTIYNIIVLIITSNSGDDRGHPDGGQIPQWEAEVMCHIKLSHIAQVRSAHD